jgi:HAE1 family hydrophobic/amphiphilic exporter-1
VTISELSIKRPVFITCILLLMMVLGYAAFKKLPVDLFPDVTLPVVNVTTAYPGAGPREVEILVSKPLEEEIGSISGIKNIRSTNREGVSIVSAEFTLETDIKYAEQQVRDHVSSTRTKLPDDIKEPTIRRLDPADQPILILTLSAQLPMAEHYDMAKEIVKPKLEQIAQVGLVEIAGGQKREIHVEMDRAKLARYQLSVSGISDDSPLAASATTSSRASGESGSPATSGSSSRVQTSAGPGPSGVPPAHRQSTARP